MASPLAAPRALNVDFLSSPALGIGTLSPRFDAIVESINASERGVKMKGIRIVCRAALSGTVTWDSGLAAADRAIGVYYGAVGAPAASLLAAGQAYTWTAQWQSADGRLSAVSPPAHFDVGLLSENDWRGNRWLGAGHREFRTSLDLSDAPTAAVARAHVSSPGGAVLLVNGVLAGRDAVGMSAWLDFTASLPSATVDIGPLLRPGETNELLLRAGCGYWCPSPVPTDQHSGRVIHTPAGAQPLARIAIAVSGVTRDTLTVLSNLSWEGRVGPTVYDSAWLGTTTNWSVPPARGWAPAREVPPAIFELAIS
jgi:hypothetical protein